MKNPYDIILSRYITEKSTVLEGLHNAESNKSLKRCKRPKCVFLVDLKAKKQEIACALEEIYKEKSIKVVSVNTCLIKRKKKRRGKGRPGMTSAAKKAIVTLEEGDAVDEL